MVTSTCNLDHLGLPIPHPLYECCEKCNYGRHQCPCCGDDVPHGESLCPGARAEREDEDALADMGADEYLDLADLLEVLQ